MACALVRFGEPDRALDVLEQLDFAVLAGSCIHYDTDLDPLREHPRFEALVARAR